jgi:hypothetical protein
MTERRGSQLPEIFCDFNARMTERGYLLTCTGTINDLAELGLSPESALGRRFTFADGDLIGDGTVISDPDYGYLALIDAGGPVPRSEIPQE